MKMEQENGLKLLLTAGTLFAAAHLLLLFFGLGQMDGDALIVSRNTALSPPLMNILLAAAELAALLMMDVLLFAVQTPRGNRNMRRYWLVCLTLAVLWASYPLPQGEVITYQADSVFFRFLPVYVVTPQFALQILLYCVFPLLREAVKVWLLQYAGAVFAAAHVLYLIVLSLRARRT